MSKSADKQIVAIDIDEVLVPYAEGLVMHHNSKYGTKLRFEDVVHHNFGEFWGVSHEEYLKRAWQYIIDNHAVAVPIEGAKQAIDKLSESYQLRLITFRSPPLKQATLAWLDKHFKGRFGEPVFLGHGDASRALKYTKAQICHEIGAGWLIDDHLKPVLEAAQSGINTILFGDYPWNQAEFLPNKVTRAKSWDDVLELLL
jgi:uncharacterized HAD superfamily protein